MVTPAHSGRTAPVAVTRSHAAHASAVIAPTWSPHETRSAPARPSATTMLWSPASRSNASSSVA